jgi:hypothetical protein
LIILPKDSEPNRRKFRFGSGTAIPCAFGTSGPMRIAAFELIETAWVQLKDRRSWIGPYSRLGSGTIQDHPSRLNRSQECQKQSSIHAGNMLRAIARPSSSPEIPPTVPREAGLSSLASLISFPGRSSRKDAPSDPHGDYGHERLWQAKGPATSGSRSCG